MRHCQYSTEDIAKLPLEHPAAPRSWRSCRKLLKELAEGIFFNQHYAVSCEQSFELKPCKSCVPSKMLSISLCIIFHTAQNIGAAMETGHDGELFVKYVQITEGIYRGKKILSRESI